MHNHIANLLYQKGYRLFDDEKGFLIRETEKIVYIVTLSIFRKEIKQKDYDNFRMRIEFKVASRYHKKVQTLHLIVAENGMFDEEALKLVEEPSAIWLIAADTGRIYIFENHLRFWLPDMPEGKSSLGAYRYDRCQYHIGKRLSWLHR